MKFNILFGGRLWTYFAQFWYGHWYKKGKVGGWVRQCLGHGHPLFASDGSNLSTSLFKNENFRMKYEKTGWSKLKYAYRVPLVISVRRKGGNKRNS